MRQHSGSIVSICVKKSFIKITKIVAHAVEHTQHYSFKLLNTKISFDLFIFLICCLL